MARRFRVGVHTGAYATVDVEISDDVLRQVAELNEGEDAIREVKKGE